MGGVSFGRVFTGWLALVVLYTVVTESDRVAGALGIVSHALTALSDPNRPLIRDHAGGGSSSSSSTSSTSSKPLTTVAPGEHSGYRASYLNYPAPPGVGIPY